MPARIHLQFGNLPVFLRWKLLFSSLPTRPFVGGVVVIVAWLLVFRFALTPLHKYLDHVLGRIVPYSTKGESLMRFFADYTIITPWLETLTFQKGVFAVAKWVRIIPSYPWIAIALSAALFASSHFWSVGYILYTFPGGCVLGAAYFYGGCNHRMFWMVVSAHSAFNGICIIPQVLEAMFGISGL